MSQKTNPISLRLQNSNKHFDSCWYSDFYYDQVCSDEIHLRTYMEGLLLQAGRSKAVASIQSQYKRYCTFLFFLDQRGERHKREFSLKLSREPIERAILPRTKFLQSKKKSCTSACNTPQSFQIQNALSQTVCSQQEKYKNVLGDLIKQERSPFTDNSKQEYIYMYANKGISLKVFSLAGLDSTKFFNKNFTQAYDCLVNPGLKQNLFEGASTSTPRRLICKNSYKSECVPRPQTPLLPPHSGDIDSSGESSGDWDRDTPHSGYSARNNAYAHSKKTQKESKHFKRGGFKSIAEVGSSTESKKSFDLPFLSFVLCRVLPFTEECIPIATGFPYMPEQVLHRVGLQLESGVESVSHSPNIVFYRPGVIQHSINQIFSRQEGRENLFRDLILAKYSLSTQNRLSFWSVKVLEKQVRTFKVPFSTTVGSIKDSTPFTFIRVVNKPELHKIETSFARQEWRSKSLGCARHTELFLNIYSGNFLYHTLFPIRAISPFQGVGFLLESIATLLKRKSSFRQIKDNFFRELSQSQYIKGARLSCAGRFGGRSKKAQKAKTQTAQWGETSLTVFCSRLAFASLGVKTTYGKVGVKLWLCYKS